jgi:hypothetical protein
MPVASRTLHRRGETSLPLDAALAPRAIVGLRAMYFLLLMRSTSTRTPRRDV